VETSTENSLVALIKEIDYQETYSYEKRVDLFNKYCIPTHLKFFNPIYELAKFILDRRSYYKSEHSDYESFGKGSYSCYSHSGNVMSSFNKDFSEKKSETVKVSINGNITIYGYDRNTSKHLPVLRFNTSKTIAILYNHFSNGINIPRNLYDLIDEWLVDFGYNKW
jgi:hypothetical protein